MVIDSNNHETNNARVNWRDYRNVRIIRSHIRNSDLLYQQQPAVTKSNAKSKTTSQQTKITSKCAASVHVSKMNFLVLSIFKKN
jgi:type VI protein secretion system component VasA